MNPQGPTRLTRADAARAVLAALATRDPVDPGSGATRIRDELGLDSMGWVLLTRDLGLRTGAWLDDATIREVETVDGLVEAVLDLAHRTRRAPGGALQRPDTVLEEAQRRRLSSRGRWEALTAGRIFALNRALARTVLRLRVIGAERLPATGPVVVAPTHASLLDGFVVAAALPAHRVRDTYFVTYAGMLTNPLVRWVGRRVRLLPIDADVAPLASLAAGAAVLDRQRTLVWFPAGHRSRTGAVQQPKPGTGWLLDQYDVPVVPVAVIGARRSMPTGARLPRPSRVTVVFGEPVRGSELAGAVSGPARRARAIDARLRERLVVLRHRGGLGVARSGAG
jgi:long-chain acyl-CoA synthetase